MKNLIWGFILISLVLVKKGISQTVYRANNIKVFHGSKELKNAFTGGFNAPIVNHIDINFDGYKDLVICNNEACKVSTFINTKTGGFNSYKYEPKYESSFPNEFENFFILRDFNRDSIPDIFVRNSSFSFNIYYGYKNNLNQLSFKLMYYQITCLLQVNNYNNLLTSRNSFILPIIEDLDSDGDIDVVFTNSSNNSEYARNMQVEYNLPKDSIKLVNKNMHYGHFALSTNPLAFVSNFFPNIELGLKAPSGVLTPRHNEYQGLWSMDVNNDGLYDLMGSNEFDQNSPLGLNIGTKDSAFIYNFDTFFPSYNQPIKKWQPLGTWSDVDGDGKKDIVVSSPMERDISSEKSLKVFNSDIDFFQVYKNNGIKVVDNITKHSDSFSRISDTFLTKEHIDVGTMSAPVFFDYNNDTLLDILIPNFYSRDSQDISSIALYQNIGTKYIPKYTQVTDDYLNFKAKNRVSIRIATGDLNSDGLNDLLITSYNLNSGIKIYTADAKEWINYEIYYQVKDITNKATFPVFDTFSSNNSMKYGIANPCLFDVNEDGKLDLLVGEKYKMRYHKNMGTATKPNFSAITNDTILNWDDILHFKERSFYPAVAKDNKNSKPYLYFAYSAGYDIFAQIIGKIGKAELNKDSIETTRCKIISKDVINNWLGRYPSLTISDINKDTLPDFLIGNYAGGIQIYSYGDIDSSKDIIIPIDPVDPIDPPNSVAIITENTSLSIYPNPLKDILNINYPGKNLEVQVNISSMDGKIVFQKIVNSHQIDISNLPTGIYILQLSATSILPQSFKLIKE